ncbi:hypothetical protein [Tychonema sp. LEGE 07203]|uniref:hypothetical protein n=1 Tax=Tychonema sp. LEGE 07203 TaxID=1828671 RepID=UPI00187F3E2D|nr:hypothetical protein [Tychonema sp. LEGE 07203]MBE9093149.1 hypothetical protein [Tychonema sp. LEGE 07203]
MVEINSEDTSKDAPAKYDSAKYNERSFSTLIRAIHLSPGYFSFLLVNCNSLDLRQQIVDRLEATCVHKPQQLVLPKSATTLYTTIAAEVEGEPPPALMILGLESVESIDRLLVSTNLVCSEFSKKFSFPVVFWVTDELLRKIIRTAPDLYNRMTTIRFLS